MNQNGSTALNRALRLDDESEDTHIQYREPGFLRRNAIVEHESDESAMIYPPQQQANSARDDQLEEFFRETLGEDVAEMIFSAAKFQTTGKRGGLNKYNKLTLKDLTEEGYCVVVVVYEYLKSQQNHRAPHQSLVHLAKAVSVVNHYDIEKSTMMFIFVMTTTKGSYGLDQFYSESHMREYFLVLIQNYLGMEVYDSIAANTPDLPNAAIDLVLGGASEMSGSLQEEIAECFLRFLFQISAKDSVWSTPVYNPAFALLFAALGVVQTVLNHDSKIFKKKGGLQDANSVRAVIFNAIYKNKDGFRLVMEAMGTLVRSDVAKGDQDTRLLRLALRPGSNNIYALYDTVFQTQGRERKEKFLQLFGSFDKRNFLYEFVLTYAEARKLYSYDLDFLTAIQHFFTAMALIHAKNGEETELLDIMAAALESVKDDKGWRKHTAKLYKSKMGHQSWKSKIGDELLRVQKSKARSNKAIIESVMRAAYEVDNSIAEQQNLPVVQKIYPNEVDDNTISKIIRMFSNHVPTMMLNHLHNDQDSNSEIEVDTN